MFPGLLWIDIDRFAPPTLKQPGIARPDVTIVSRFGSNYNREFALWSLLAIHGRMESERGFAFLSRCGKAWLVGLFSGAV